MCALDSQWDALARTRSWGLAADGKTAFRSRPRYVTRVKVNSSNNYEDSCGDERLFV